MTLSPPNNIIPSIPKHTKYYNENRERIKKRKKQRYEDNKAYYQKKQRDYYHGKKINRHALKTKLYIIKWKIFIFKDLMLPSKGFVPREKPTRIMYQEISGFINFNEAFDKANEVIDVIGDPDLSFNIQTYGYLQSRIP